MENNDSNRNSIQSKLGTSENSISYKVDSSGYNSSNNNKMDYLERKSINNLVGTSNEVGRNEEEFRNNAIPSRIFLDSM